MKSKQEKVLNSFPEIPGAQEPGEGATQTGAEILVGRRIRLLRRQHGLSLKSLAQHSGLNINTLSMIENGKSSPSVGTLQQLAQALAVPLSSFFETTMLQKQVVHLRADQRPGTFFNKTRIESLGQGLTGNVVQPFIVYLKPEAGSGQQAVLHTGFEFVFCLFGEIIYRIDEKDYTLTNGDSLLFESHLPHRWQNKSTQEAAFLLIFYPADSRDNPTHRHFIGEKNTEK